VHVHVSWQVLALLVVGVVLLFVAARAGLGWIRALGIVVVVSALLAGGLGIWASRPPANLNVKGVHYGQEEGTFDPRARPCEPLPTLVKEGWVPQKGLTPAGRTERWFGPRMFIVPGHVVLVEVSSGCFLWYPPWI